MQIQEEEPDDSLDPKDRKIEIGVDTSELPLGGQPPRTARNAPSTSPLFRKTRKHFSVAALAAAEFEVLLLREQLQGLSHEIERLNSERSDGKPANIQVEPVPASGTEGPPHLSEAPPPEEPVLFVEADDKPIPPLPFALSNKVHILGFTTHAKWLAHALASIPDAPPVSMLVGHPIALQQWGEAERQISLFDSQGKHLSDAPIPYPELIPNRFAKYEGGSEMGPIHNLIVHTTSSTIITKLAHIQERIDSRTTICLIEQGFGMAEKIIQELFPNPMKRPNIVLGESYHKVYANSKTNKFQIRLKTSKHLALCGFPKSAASLEGLPQSLLLAAWGRQQTQHFISILKEAPRLNPLGRPVPDFLLKSLHRLLFSSVADSLSVIMGGEYGTLRHSPYAMKLWFQLVEESVEIITKLPELQKWPNAQNRITPGYLKRRLKLHLNAMRWRRSPWINEVRVGYEPPVDNFNGYLVRRAKELGLDHKHNTMILNLVKARRHQRSSEIHALIPWGGQRPYMLENDLINTEQNTEQGDQYRAFAEYEA
ncbi:hypothetical protein F5Y18DRAFT_401028 [Xylariaceae sp. FL1019]|nr:hypothetical protein F5Y18DRAFT_401028 [Xylariaceae sp. FL1019]